MNRKRQIVQKSVDFKRRLLCVAVASAFGGAAYANPTGPQVVSGQAAFATQGNTLSVTNSPNAIINWQSFSIGASETTRFVQQSVSSAVLNRVVGIDPSIILGTLQSNGKVFLINPSGVLFGQGSRIDVAGLVASTLNLSNEDFLAGRLNFATGAIAAGALKNDGTITTPSGGSVILVAPQVGNNGIINAPNGDVILAAGHSVRLGDSGAPNVLVELQAPETEAINVGEIIVGGGSAGIYAGLVRQEGVVRADSVSVNEAGRIVFKATKDVTLASGSLTSANGVNGGQILVQAESGTNLVHGEVTAIGTSGVGGGINLLGAQVGVAGNARVDASGEIGGGTILVGGDNKGGNAAIQNARATYFGATASLTADAIGAGNGGRIILWSDEVTRAYGQISAKGGETSGNGGFVETSSKGHLDVTATPYLTATNGVGGTWLLDPSNITVVVGTTGTGSLDDSTPNFVASADSSTVSNGVINVALDAGTSVILDTTNAGGGQLGDITVNADAPITKTLVSGIAPTLSFFADNDITVRAPITDVSGQGFNVIMDSGRTTPTGRISMEFNAPTLGDIGLDTGNGSFTADNVDFSNGATYRIGGQLNVTGQLSLSANATLELTNNKVFHSADTMLLDPTNGGFVKLKGGAGVRLIVPTASTVEISDLNTSGQGVVFLDGLSLETIATTLDTHFVTLQNGATLDTEFLDMTSGKIQGAGNLSVNNSFSATGGSIEMDLASSTLSIHQSSGTLDLSIPIQAQHVSLSTSEGSILDGNGAANNITAQTLSMTSFARIGTYQTDPGTGALIEDDPIETSVSQISAEAGTFGGSVVNIANIGDVAVNRLSSEAGTIRFVNDGQIDLPLNCPDGCIPTVDTAGGSVYIDSTSGSIFVDGEINASGDPSGNLNGGTITLESSGSIDVAVGGVVATNGANSIVGTGGFGGEINLISGGYITVNGALGSSGGAGGIIFGGALNGGSGGDGGVVNVNAPNGNVILGAVDLNGGLGSQAYPEINQGSGNGGHGGRLVVVASGDISADVVNASGGNSGSTGGFFPGGGGTGGRVNLFTGVAATINVDTVNVRGGDIGGAGGTVNIAGAGSSLGVQLGSVDASGADGVSGGAGGNLEIVSSGDLDLSGDTTIQARGGNGATGLSGFGGDGGNGGVIILEASGLLNVSGTFDASAGNGGPGSGDAPGGSGGAVTFSTIPLPLFRADITSVPSTSPGAIDLGTTTIDVASGLSGTSLEPTGFRGLVDFYAGDGGVSQTGPLSVSEGDFRVLSSGNVVLNNPANSLAGIWGDIGGELLVTSMRPLELGYRAPSGFSAPGGLTVGGNLIAGSVAGSGIQGPSLECALVESCIYIHSNVSAGGHISLYANELYIAPPTDPDLGTVSTALGDPLVNYVMWTPWTPGTDVLMDDLANVGSFIETPRLIIGDPDNLGAIGTLDWSAAINTAAELGSIQRIEAYATDINFEADLGNFGTGPLPLTVKFEAAGEINIGAGLVGTPFTTIYLGDNQSLSLTAGVSGLGDLIIGGTDTTTLKVGETATNAGGMLLSGRNIDVIAEGAGDINLLVSGTGSQTLEVQDSIFVESVAGGSVHVRTESGMQTLTSNVALLSPTPSLKVSSQFSTTGGVFVETVSGDQIIGVAGGVTVTSGAGATTAASIHAGGNQNVDAGWVRLWSTGGSSSADMYSEANQTITTTAFGPAGWGIALVNTGSSGNTFLGTNGAQVLNVRDSSGVVVGGGSIGRSSIYSALSQNITMEGASSLNFVQISADHGETGISSGGTQTIVAGQAGQSGGITVRGGVGAGAGAYLASDNLDQTIRTSGDILLHAGTANEAYANIGSGAKQSIQASGNLQIVGGMVSGTDRASAVIYANADQTITANSLTITTPSGPVSSGVFLPNGDQTITTTGSAANGYGITVENLGASGPDQVGFPSTAFIVGRTGAQTIDVSNSAGIRISATGGDAAGIFGEGASQLITIHGSGNNELVISGGTGSAQVLSNGPQTVTAGLAGEAGGISLHGGTADKAFALIVSNNGSQNISTSGQLSLTGGVAPGPAIPDLANPPTDCTVVSACAVVVAHGGQQTISADAVSITGGALGNENLATILGDSGQDITIGGGGLTMQGGEGAGLRNYAFIENRANDQILRFTAGAPLSLTGGTTGIKHFAAIEAVGDSTSQQILGNPMITLTGGASGGGDGSGFFETFTGNNAYIGTDPYGAVATSQTIDAQSIVLQGGFGANNSIIGNFRIGGQQTIKVLGDGRLLGGSGSFSEALFLSFGDQTVQANSIQLIAADGGGFAAIYTDGGGNQHITTSGSGPNGWGIELANYGAADGVLIETFGAQEITATNGGGILVDATGGNAHIRGGGFWGDNGFVVIGDGQSIAIDGATSANGLILRGGSGTATVEGGDQSITAGTGTNSGSVLLQGGASNFGNSYLFAHGGTQNVATTGQVSVVAGSAPGVEQGLFACGPSACALIGNLEESSNPLTVNQTISAQGGIIVRGGSGGEYNEAAIFTHGSQSVDAPLGILTQGGSGVGNYAAIAVDRNGYTQMIDFGSGDLQVLGGSNGGWSIGQIYSSGAQTISGTGDIVLRGGTSAGTALPGLGAVYSWAEIVGNGGADPLASQSITANSISITADPSQSSTGIFTPSGQQINTTGNPTGYGISITNLGATGIDQNGFAAAAYITSRGVQSIDVANSGGILISASGGDAGIFGEGASQSITIHGSTSNNELVIAGGTGMAQLFSSGPQTVMAGSASDESGGIRVSGGTVGAAHGWFFSNADQIVNTVGNIVLDGGSGNRTFIFGNASGNVNGRQEISANAISITANIGPESTGIFTPEGTQHISTTGTIGGNGAQASYGIAIENIAAIGVDEAGYGAAAFLTTRTGTQQIDVAQGGILIKGTGGLAVIDSEGPSQKITITSGALDLEAANGSAIISFAFGDSQTISADSISLQGGNQDGAIAVIEAFNGTQEITASGRLSLTAGQASGPAAPDPEEPPALFGASSGSATIISRNGLQTIDAFGISLTGGGGNVDGDASENFANIRSDAGQHIIVGADGLTLQGGSGSGLHNFAIIENYEGEQKFEFADSAVLDITGGTNGVRNFAGIFGGGPISYQYTVLANTPLETDPVTRTTDGTSSQQILGNPEIILNGGATGGGGDGTEDPHFWRGNAAFVVAETGAQTINAQSIDLTGGGGIENSATVSAWAQGANQSVTAIDSIILTGGSAPYALAEIHSDWQQTIQAGGISLLGGTASQDAYASIESRSGPQIITINNGGSLLLEGGASGSDNSVNMDSGSGYDQTIAFAAGGVLHIRGGAGGIDNTARIESGANQIISGAIDISLIGGSGAMSDANLNAESGSQFIGSSDTPVSSLSLMGGAGLDAMATMTALTQDIWVAGATSLTGGGGGGALAAIGSDQQPVNVTLRTGTLTMLGGAGGIGSEGNPYPAVAMIGAVNGPTADLDIQASGDITLSSSISGSQIGSVAGGDVSVTSTGGSVLLNDALATIQGGSVSITAADSITVLGGVGSLTGGVDLTTGGSGSVVVGETTYFSTGTAIVNLNSPNLELASDFAIPASGWAFAFPAALTISSSLGATLINEGILTLGTTTVTALLDNQGLINVEAGTLSLANGGSGDYNIAADALLDFASGTFNLGFMSGTGTVDIDTPASVGIASNSTIGTLNLNGGTLGVGSGATLAVSGMLNLATGTADGAGSLTAANLEWSGGTIALGNVTTAGGGTHALSGTNARSFGGGVWDNLGTMTWDGAGQWNITGGAVFNNTGSFTVTGDFFLGGGVGAGVFNNLGTFTKSGGAATGSVSPFFNNSGAVYVNSGTLNLGFGDSSGVFSIASGSTLMFGAGTHTLGATSSLTDAGGLVVTSSTVILDGGFELAGTVAIGDSGNLNFNSTASGGTLAVNGTGVLGGAGDVTFANLSLSGGTLSGTGNLSVTNNFTQTGGTVGGGYQNLALTRQGNFSVGSYNAVNALELNAVGGNLLVNDVSLAAANMTLTGSNIILQPVSSSGSTVNAGNNLTVTTPGELRLDGTSGQSKLLAGGTMSITAGTVNLSAGGFGASIDPTLLTVNATGDITLNGGTAVGAQATIAGDNVSVSGANIFLNGGSTPDADATIQALSGSATINATNLLSFVPGTGTDADAAILAPSGTATLTAASCIGCVTLDSSPQGDTNFDYGAYAASIVFGGGLAPVPSELPPEVDNSIIYAASLAQSGGEANTDYSDDDTEEDDDSQDVEEGGNKDDGKPKRNLPICM